MGFSGGAREKAPLGGATVIDLHMNHLLSSGDLETRKARPSSDRAFKWTFNKGTQAPIINRFESYPPDHSMGARGYTFGGIFRNDQDGNDWNE